MRDLGEIDLATRPALLEELEHAYLMPQFQRCYVFAE